MKYLLLIVLGVSIGFVALDTTVGFEPSLIAMSGTKIKENETTFYQLNCSSIWSPLGKSAEFIVNGKSVQHISVFDDKCFNNEGKECFVNLISYCYCIPDKQIFIFKFKERNIDENIFSCQMRFKDDRNKNIIKAMVSIVFNGSEDELYEYDVKLLGNKAENRDKNITENKELASEHLEIWLPVSFSISLVVIAIWTTLCAWRRRQIYKNKRNMFEKDEPGTTTEELLVKEHHGIVEDRISMSKDITEEEENFIQLFRLVSCVALQAVRKVFDKCFPPTSLPTMLMKQRYSITLLVHKKRLNSKQMDILFPKNGVTSSSKYDVPLMICLLRNFSPIREPRFGFDELPPINEIHTGADLARVKYYRNTLTCAAINRVPSSEFATFWNDLEQALVRLGGSEITTACIAIKQRRFYSRHLMEHSSEH